MRVHNRAPHALRREGQSTAASTGAPVAATREASGEARARGSAGKLHCKNI